MSFEPSTTFQALAIMHPYRAEQRCCECGWTGPDRMGASLELWARHLQQVMETGLTFNDFSYERETPDHLLRDPDTGKPTHQVEEFKIRFRGRRGLLLRVVPEGWR